MNFSVYICHVLITNLFHLFFSSIQLLSCVQLFSTPWTVAYQASVSITNPWSYSNWCSLSQWCHPTISSSIIPFSHPWSCPAWGTFQMNQLFTWGGQSIGVSASASVLPMNIQDWFPWGWTGWISLQSKSLLQHHSSKASILRHSAFFTVQLSHPYITTGKTTALTRRTFVGKVMSLLLTCCLRWSQLCFQGVTVFLFHGCHHHLQWFWSPPK